LENFTKKSDAVAQELAAVESTSNKPDASAKLPTTSVKSSKPRKGKKKKRKGKQTLVALTRKSVAPIPPSNFPDTFQDAHNKTVPLWTIDNLEYLFQQYAITARYNVIGKDINLNIPHQVGCPDNWETAAIATVRSLAKLNRMSTANIGDYITAIANMHMYNPVSEWIHSKPWDGIDRLEDFFQTLSVKADYPIPLRDILLRRWLISAVAAGVKPSGFGSRGVLVLQGAQSIGKTRWIMNLVPDATLQEQLVKIDHHLDASDKDSKLTALRHWVVEIGELDSSFRKDVARLKGFITGTKDKIRIPYGTTDSHFSRRTVFCATVNKQDFLVDETGNTRWWTIPVTEIDYEHGIDMQQLFAQVHSLFKAGEQWWLTKEEEELLESCNTDHQATTAIKDLIEANVDFTMKASWQSVPLQNGTQILQALGIQNPTNAQVKDCGAVMKQHLGDRKKSNGLSGWRIEFITKGDITSI
jgi:putative DNA primase/helicase